MDRGAWRATVHGHKSVGRNLVTNSGSSQNIWVVEKISVTFIIKTMYMNHREFGK